MAINFPPKPQPDGKEYVDPNSGKWVYDLSNNSWTLVAPGNVSPFNYRGGHDFNSATVPTNVKSGDAWTHSGTDGAAINAVYIGMTGTIAAGQFVVFDGSEYTKVSSVAGYPNVGDGDGATLDTRYVKKKGETSQGIEGSVCIGADNPQTRLQVTQQFDTSTCGIRLTRAASTASYTQWVDVNANYQVGYSNPVTSDPSSSIFTLSQGGNLGLGATQPSSKVVIRQNQADYSNLDFYNETAGGGITFRQIHRNIDNTGSDSCDLAWLKSGGFAINNNDTNSSNYTAFRVGNSPEIRIDSSGNMGIGVNTPQSELHLQRNTQLGITIERTGAAASTASIRNESQQLILSQNTDGIAFETGASPSTRVRIDSSGRLLVGYESHVSQGGFTPTLQQHAKSASGTGIYRWSNDGGAPILGLAKSRGTAPGTNAIVQNNDPLGALVFSGDDGTGLNTQAASIVANVDGTPGTNNIPSRLVFSTTADGSSSPQERFRIDNRGRINTESAVNDDSYFTMRGTSPTTTSNAYLFRHFVDIPSSVTDNVFAFHSAARIDDGASLGTFWHYTAVQSPKPAGATIATQVGFYAGGNLIDAGTNYGFSSDIPAGSNRWNFFAGGTAQNYFAGNTLVGGTNGNPVVNNVYGIALRTDGHILSNTTSSGSVSGFRRNGDGDLITFHNNNSTACGSIKVTGQATSYEETSDYRLKENISPLAGAVDQLKALKPCVYNFKTDPDTTLQGFIAHEAQEVCPQAVSGTKDATEAIGTLFDWDGSVLEENVTEPTELTYTEEVVDDPGQDSKDAVYSEPVLIQEYQPAVYSEPVLIQEAQPAMYSEPELIEAATEDSEAVYSHPELISPPVPEQWSKPELISPEVPEQWSEPELISPAVEHRDPTYKTVTRQMSWKKTGDRDVMQGIDKSKLVPLLTAALQEALGRIEALEAAIASKGA